MQILNDILFLASVFLTACCMTGIIAGIRDDADKRYWKRRNEGRRKAYAAVYKRRCVRENREQLWESVRK